MRMDKNEASGLTETPLFPIEFENVEPYAMFSIEHWLACYSNGLTPAPPFMLSPFPPQTHRDEELFRDMERWGLYDGKKLDSDLLYILNSITQNYTHGVFGTIMLHQRESTRVIDSPDSLISLGAPRTIESLEIPTYPFIIANTLDGFIVSCVSTDKGLTFNVSQYKDTPFERQAANELREIIDPENLWEPYPTRELHVPYDLFMSTAMARVWGAKPGGERDAVIREVSVENSVSSGDVSAVVKMTSGMPLVMVSVIPIVRRKDGNVFSHSSAMTTITLSEVEEGVRQAYVMCTKMAPTGDKHVHYRSYTDGGLAESIAECFEVLGAVHRSTGGLDRNDPLYVLTVGVETAIESDNDERSRALLERFKTFEKCASPDGGEDEDDDSEGTNK